MASYYDELMRLQEKARKAYTYEPPSKLLTRWDEQRKKAQIWGPLMAAVSLVSKSDLPFRSFQMQHQTEMQEIGNQLDEDWKKHQAQVKVAETQLKNEWESIQNVHNTIEDMRRRNPVLQHNPAFIKAAKEAEDKRDIRPLLDLMGTWIDVPTPQTTEEKLMLQQRGPVRQVEGGWQQKIVPQYEKGPIYAETPAGRYQMYKTGEELPLPPTVRAHVTGLPQRAVPEEQLINEKLKYLIDGWGFDEKQAAAIIYGGGLPANEQHLAYKNRVDNLVNIQNMPIEQAQAVAQEEMREMNNLARLKTEIETRRSQEALERGRAGPAAGGVGVPKPPKPRESIQNIPKEYRGGEGGHVETGRLAPVDEAGEQTGGIQAVVWGFRKIHTDYQNQPPEVQRELRREDKQVWDAYLTGWGRDADAVNEAMFPSDPVTYKYWTMFADEETGKISEEMAGPMRLVSKYLLDAQEIYKKQRNFNKWPMKKNPDGSMGYPYIWQGHLDQTQFITDLKVEIAGEVEGKSAEEATKYTAKFIEELKKLDNVEIQSLHNNNFEKYQDSKTGKMVEFLIK